jgi:hypothetical protein
MRREMMSISNLRRSIFAIVLLVTFLLQAPLSFACGPFSLGAVFTFTVHPEYPLENFARGEIGVVQPSYARSYLYVAYRYLSGAGFKQTEQQALVDLWRDRLDLRWEPEAEQAVQEWLSARQKVLTGPPPKIDVYRNREKPNEYETYLNCQKDAFETAATTLDSRIKQFGSENPALKQWVEAQDQVFANCSEGQHIPTALPADSDGLLRADREYQIAAANFYAGNFAVAKTLFESIAVDAKSPWHETAPYLGARTLVRKASLGPAETKKAALAEAEEQLNKILTNPELKSSHPATKRLLSVVRIRLHPEERRHELALSLASNSDHASLKQDLWDYTLLLDEFVGDDEAHHQKATASRAAIHDDDLTDWIVTFQSDKAEALDHSLARWQATSSVPWLIAALSKVSPQHAKAAMLQQAAANILPSSPAFASASFHSIRLDIVAGRSTEARTKLDDLLRKHRSRFNLSSFNLLQRQRMIVSNSLDDFLTYAPRVPAGFSWDEDGRQIPVEESEVSEELKPLQGRTLFDSDAGEILNRRMPLALLSRVAGNNRLPGHLRRDVTQAVWLRSVLLDDTTTATALVPTLKAMVPELTPFLNEYVSAREPAAKKFSAIYAWLKFPGLEPVIDTGVGRQTLLGEQDSYRDNWWCSAAFSAPETTTSEDKKTLPRIPADQRVPIFLTVFQRTNAEKEYATLATLGAGPNYLCRQVLAWAAKNPGDPRVPEALHLAVKTTRYGCTDKQTGNWSKTAYDFLHRRYPNNAWTKQTPYWFKD